MRTGLTKREKTTAIFFDEYGSMIEVQTHNTDLIKRLSAFAAKYPECCRQIDDNEQGGLTFEIEKGRLSFRLTAPYSEERRQFAKERAIKQLLNGSNWCAPRQVDSEIIYILRMKILPAYHMVLGAMQPVDGHGLP